MKTFLLPPMQAPPRPPANRDHMEVRMHDYLQPLPADVAPADVVVLHSPRTSAPFMAQLESGEVTGALHDALKAEQIQAVGLDVLPEEPADPEHPLIKAWAADEDWIADRLPMTPHSAFFTPESVYDMRFKGGDLALTYLSGGRLQNCVNGDFLATRRPV